MADFVSVEPADPTEDEGDELRLLGPRVVPFFALLILIAPNADRAVVDEFRDITAGPPLVEADEAPMDNAALLTSFSNSAIGSLDTNSLLSYCTTT